MATLHDWNAVEGLGNDPKGKGMMRKNAETTHYTFYRIKQGTVLVLIFIMALYTDRRR